MKDSLLAKVALFSLLLCLASCSTKSKPIKGSGKVIEETREVKAFDKIAVRGLGELMIKQSGKESVLIEAEDNILPHLQARVVDDTLQLGPDSLSFEEMIRPTRPIRYVVTVNELDGINLMGSGSITSISKIKVDDLDLVLDGTGHINMSIEGKGLTVSISGAGKADLRGEVEHQLVRLSGAGRYDAANLESDVAEVYLNGAGMIAVDAQQKLLVRIAGTGRVLYKGDPKISQTISGTGSVEKIPEEEEEEKK